jgi:hypothetical protein
MAVTKIPERTTKRSKHLVYLIVSEFQSIMAGRHGKEEQHTSWWPGSTE